MRTPKLWAQDKALSGLLFFAQSVESMLFSYAPDSYRVPTLTTLSRVREAIIIMERIKREEIAPGNLPPVIEEIKWSLNKDPVAKEILGGRIEYIDKYLSDLSNSANIEKGCSYIIRNIEDRYEEKCVELLNKEIENGKNKRLIYELSQIFCNIVSLRYSKGYVYYIIRETYLSKKSQKPPSFLEFISKLPKEKAKYEIYCRLSDGLVEFFERLDFQNWNIVKKKDVKISEQRLTKTFFGDEPDAPFLRLQIDGLLEHEGARATAERLLILLKGVLSSLIHREELSWDSKMFVRKVGDVNGLVLGKPLSEMLKRSDMPFDKAMSRFQQKMELLFGDNSREENREKLVAWFINHDAALLSARVETQLITLWSSLEVMMPTSLQGAKISGYVARIIPVLMIGYVKRRYLYAFSEFKSAYGRDFIKQVGSLEHSGNLLDKFCLIISDPNNEALYKDVLGLAAQNPLHIFRLNELRTKFSTPHQIRKRISEHENKLKWHIQRIYRERNNIVHTGMSFGDAALLTVHLHEYCDTMIETLDLYMHRKTRLRELRYVFDEISTDYNLYLECINKFRESDQVSADNFRAVFGLLALQP